MKNLKSGTYKYRKIKSEDGKYLRSIGLGPLADFFDMQLYDSSKLNTKAR